MKRTRHILPLVLLGSSILCAGVARWVIHASPDRVESGESVFAGPTSIDFGVVEIVGDNTSVTHEFRLHNRGSRTIRIGAINASCGCLASVADRDAVEPDEWLGLTASMSVSDSGPKQATVFVQTDHPDQPLLQLRLRALGRRVQNLTTSTNTIEIAVSRPGTVMVYYTDYEVAAAPPLPTLEHDGSFTLDFPGWTLLSAGTLSDGVPSRWRAAIDVNAAHAPLGHDRRSSPLVIRMPNGPPLSVKISIDADRTGRVAGPPP